jgi:hypothetical protein
MMYWITKSQRFGQALISESFCLLPRVRGRQNANYHFDAKYRALVSDAHVPIAQQIRDNIFFLPQSCFISLEKVAQQTVLDHIEGSLTKRKGLVQKITRFKEESGKSLTVGNFLTYFDLEPREIYGKSSFQHLCAEASLCEIPTQEDDDRITTAAKRLLLLNSVSVIRFIRQFIATKNFDFVLKEDPKRDSCLAILYYSFHSKPITATVYPDVLSSMQPFLGNEWMVHEIDSLLSYLEEKTDVL